MARRFPFRRLGLRARITLSFGLGALLLSSMLAVTVFGVTRENLLSQRERTVVDGAFLNASFVLSRLGSGTAELDEAGLLSSLQTPTGSRPILFRNDSWFVQTAEFGEDSIPASLRDVAAGDTPARMRYGFAGEPQLAVGVPLPAADAIYFEVVSLAETENALEALGVTLVAAGAITTLAGTALGAWASRRAVRPLADVSTAAEAIAGGRLDTRLQAVADPDLTPLITSFNEMAAALEQRIERDARFASDVSHELRSPLMTLSASIEVLETRRDELSERSLAALELLVADVARFQTLVEDLLEISRADAGALQLQAEPVLLAELVEQAVARHDTGATAVTVDRDVEESVAVVDKRRLMRVIANLLDNAAKYGGERACVSVRRGGRGTLQIVVEDDGPGVAQEDREQVFERFSRGGTAGDRAGASAGVGLGLSLVREHVRLHGGTIELTDRADGGPGACFVVTLPEVDG